MEMKAIVSFFVFDTFESNLEAFLCAMENCSGNYLTYSYFYQSAK